MPYGQPYSGPGWAPPKKAFQTLYPQVQGPADCTGQGWRTPQKNQGPSVLKPTTYYYPTAIQMGHRHSYNQLIVDARPAQMVSSLTYRVSTSHISSPLTMARVGSLPKCLQAQTNLVSRDNDRQSAPSTPLDPLSPNTILQHFSYIRRAKCTRSSYTPLRSLTQNTFNNHLRTSYERKLRHFMKVPLLAVFRIMILAPY